MRYLPFALILLFSCSSNSGQKGQRMAHTKSPMNAQDCLAKKLDAWKLAHAKIDIHVFSNDELKKDPNLHGYGYDILMYDAVYVHQPHIPAINGYRGFSTKDQAQKVAELVVYKIRHNIMPPALSIEEMDKIGALK